MYVAFKGLKNLGRVANWFATSGGSRGGARGARPPVFLDQTEAQRAEKKLFWRPGSPLSQDLDDRAPTPLSEGLDPPLATKLWRIVIPEYDQSNAP